MYNEIYTKDGLNFVTMPTDRTGMTDSPLYDPSCSPANTLLFSWEAASGGVKLVAPVIQMTRRLTSNTLSITVPASGFLPFIGVIAVFGKNYTPVTISFYTCIGHYRLLNGEIYDQVVDKVLTADGWDDPQLFNPDAYDYTLTGGFFLRPKYSTVTTGTLELYVRDHVTGKYKGITFIVGANTLVITGSNTEITTLPTITSSAGFLEPIPVNFLSNYSEKLLSLSGQSNGNNSTDVARRLFVSI